MPVPLFVTGSHQSRAGITLGTTLRRVTIARYSVLSSTNSSRAFALSKYLTVLQTGFSHQK
jgi:hypothetical protein